MKKVLVILAVLAMTGFASAAMLNNPEDFSGYASGTVLWASGAPVDGWEGWGSGSGDAGWGGQNSANITVGSGASAAVQSYVPAAQNWWGYNLLINHGNAVAGMDQAVAVGTAELTFDVLSINVDGIAKIEYWADEAHTVALGVDAWDPWDMSALGTQTYVGTMPVGANYITVVLGVTGVGGVGIFDNIAIDANPIPEPATMVLLGLGGLLLRRKK